MSESFYVIAKNHRALVERIKDADLDEQTAIDTLEAESYPLEEKGKCIAYAIKELELVAEAAKKAEQEVIKRRKALEARAERLKKYALDCMTLAGVTKIECPEFAMAVRNNPKSVEIFEKDLIPEEFWQRPPAYPNKAAIADALKAGQDVPGCRLKQTQRIDVR